MASFMSSATSTRPGPLCVCGFGYCLVKISRSLRNPGYAYYQCARVENVVKFRTKSLEHLELMRRVYEGATIAGKNAWTPSQALNPFQVDEETSTAEDDFKDSNGLPPFEAVHDTTDDLPLSELVHHIVDPCVHEESLTILVEDVSTGGSKWKYTGKIPMQHKQG